jgi:agmatinase
MRDEVAPDYAHSGSISILAAQVLMNLIGYVFHGRHRRQQNP